MPVMDGIETLRHIRKFDKRLPVIIITVAYTDRDKMTEANKLGSSGFFPKKGTFDELERLIEVSLRAHKKLKR
jgi:DNA-binding NarL/FixJ family response regulator